MFNLIKLIFFLKTHCRILTKVGRNHPSEEEIQSCSNGTRDPHGGQEEGPKD